MKENSFQNLIFFQVLTLKMVVFPKTSTAYNLDRSPNFLAGNSLQIILLNRFAFCFKDGKNCEIKWRQKHRRNGAETIFQNFLPVFTNIFQKTLENVCSAQKIKK